MESICYNSHLKKPWTQEILVRGVERLTSIVESLGPGTCKARLSAPSHILFWINNEEAEDLTRSFN